MPLHHDAPDAPTLGRIECPGEVAIQLLQGKWKVRILCMMRRAPVRLGQLQRLIPLASKKVLIENLRELERDGLIARTDLGGTVRRVEYALSESLVVTIHRVLEVIDELGETYSKLRS